MTSNTNPLQVVVELLSTAGDLANKISVPVKDFSSLADTARGLITKIENLIDGVDDAVSIAVDIAVVCNGLGALLVEIPPVGELLESVGTAIDEFSAATKEIMMPIKDFKQEVLVEVGSVLGKICDVCDKINKYVSYFTTHISVWTNTVKVIWFGWEVVSVLIKVLESTEPGKRLKDLLSKFDTIGKAIKSAYEGVSGPLEEIFHVISKTLQPALDPVTKFIDEVFTPIQKELDMVSGVFSDVKSVMDKVENAIAPVKWVLEAVEWLINDLLKPILDALMNKLDLQGLIDDFVEKIEHTLHIDGLLDGLKGLFDSKKLTSSNKIFTNNLTGASKIDDMAIAFKEYSSDPTQVLMAAIFTAVSGTPVAQNSFPPRPIPLPPLHVDPRSLTGSQKIFMKLTTSTSRALIGKLPSQFKVTRILFVAIANPSPPSSPTDWSHVDQFVKDVGKISSGLQPVITLGGQLDKFTATAQKQMGIPGELHTKLSDLAGLVKFLHDTSQFLQQFPAFKSFLSLLTASLADEQKAIADLDTDMNQLIQSTDDLSSTVKIIANANESLTLTTAIKHLTSSLDNWKMATINYRGLLQKYYSLDKSGKFKDRIDAVAATYHQHIAQLQDTLNKIIGIVKQSGKDGNAITCALHTACGEFNKLDSSVDQLEVAIGKVQEVSSFAANFDSIFKPLQWMLTQQTCIGDEDGFKINTMKIFQSLSKLTSYPAVKTAFEDLFTELINHYMPVQTVTTIVKGTQGAIATASATISKTQSNYLQQLQSLQQIQVGQYQYTFHNPKTKQNETIKNLFFDNSQVQEIAQLGKDLSAFN